MAATLNVRLSAMMGLGLNLNFGAWLQLAELNTALRIQAAISAGHSPFFGDRKPVARGGVPAFFAALGPLSALLTMMAQLNVSTMADLQADAMASCRCRRYRR